MFSKEDLVSASLEVLQNVGIANEMKALILETAIPRRIWAFRFLMGFEPLSEDCQIGELTGNMEQLFTIGYKSATPLVILVGLSEIGLNDSASLSDIDEQIKKLDEDEKDFFIPYGLFEYEVKFCDRICIDFEKNGEVVSIRPKDIPRKDISRIFVNSNIQKLADSLAVFDTALSNTYLANYNERFLMNSIMNSIEEFEKEIKKIDPKIMQYKENLWEEIIEDMRLEAEGY